MSEKVGKPKVVQGCSVSHIPNTKWDVSVGGRGSVKRSSYAVQGGAHADAGPDDDEEA